LAPNLTGEEYRFLTKWREEYPRKAEKNCNHRGFTFSAKKTEIGDKTKKGGKKR
jgi:hypothetical protein